MTTATQGQIRSWARAQKMTVNDRGSLPASTIRAYAAAHATKRKGTPVTGPARKATARRTSKTATRPARPPKAAGTDPTAEVGAPAAGTIDLAGGLRAYLGSVDIEVRAVSSLSARIDALVTELNDLRDQQAKRLIVLDELRASVTDQSLGAFLDQAIKPRKTRVPEVVPERLS